MKTLKNSGQRVKSNFSWIETFNNKISIYMLIQKAFALSIQLKSKPSYFH